MRFSSPTVILLILLTLAVQAVYFAQPAERGLPLDDGWIHATYARNLAEHGQLCLNPGRPSSGTTSFLWTVLLAAGHPVAGPVFTPTILNALAQAAVALLVFLLVSEWTKDRRTAMLAACSSALLGQLVWLSLSGMETTLFLALGLGAVACWRRGRALACGVLAALLALTRPEGLALAAAVGLFELRRARRPLPVRRWASLFGPTLVGFALYVGVNLALTGRPLTSTFLGRRWLAGQPEAISLAPGDLANQALALGGLWLRELHRWVFGSGMLLLSGCQSANVVAGAIGAAIGLTALWGLRTLWRKGGPSWRLMLLWTLGHNAAYVVLLPATGHVGRYQAVNYVILIVATVAGAMRLVQGKRTTRRLGFAAIALWAVACLSGTWLWGRIYRDSVDHIRTVHIACGTWIAEELPPGAVVATFDLGAVAYFAEREIVDLGGLVDPAMARCMYAGDASGYVKRRGTTHLAMVQRKKGGTVIARKLGLLDSVGGKPLRTWQVDAERYVLHHRATSNAMPFIVLYATQEE